MSEDFDFIVGPQVPSGGIVSVDDTPVQVASSRGAWFVRVLAAVTAEPWAVGVQRTDPDGRLTIFDLSDDSLWEATSNAYAIHVLTVRPT